MFNVEGMDMDMEMKRAQKVSLKLAIFLSVFSLKHNRYYIFSFSFRFLCYEMFINSGEIYPHLDSLEYVGEYIAGGNEV